MNAHVIECMNYAKSLNHKIDLSLFVSGASELIPRAIYTIKGKPFDGEWEYDDSERAVTFSEDIKDGSEFIIQYGAVMKVEDDAWDTFKEQYYDMFKKVYCDGEE